MRKCLTTAAAIAAAALMIAGGAGAAPKPKPGSPTPYIVCGALNPGHAAVSWSGDTAIGTAAGASDTCDQVVVFYNWNGGGWTRSNTYQASPGQTGHLDIQVGDSNLNYCDPTAGLNCDPSTYSGTDWTDPNGGTGCTVNCTGGGGSGGGSGGSGPSITALSSNTPVPSGNSTLLSYSWSGCANITVSPGGTFAANGTSGSATYNAGVQPDGSDVTYSVSCTSSSGAASNTLSTTVHTNIIGQGGNTDCSSAPCPEAGYDPTPLDTNLAQSTGGGTGSGSGPAPGECDILGLPNFGSLPRYSQQVPYVIIMHGPYSVDCWGVDTALSVQYRYCMFYFTQTPTGPVTTLPDTSCAVGNVNLAAPFQRAFDVPVKHYTCPKRTSQLWRLFLTTQVVWEEGPPTATTTIINVPKSLMCSM